MEMVKCVDCDTELPITKAYETTYNTRVDDEDEPRNEWRCKSCEEEVWGDAAEECLGKEAK